MAPVHESDLLEPVDRTYVLLNRKRLSFFAGCDYYRLSSDARVVHALKRGIDSSGLSVAASRLTTGNHPLYGALEKELAEFFQAEQATVVSTGYLSDLVAAEALAGEFSHVLLDAAAHPALKRAADILRCPVLTFASRHAADLKKAAERCGPESRPIVLTEGMFSRDGSVAPLKDYLRVLPRQAMILVDDAHGAGIVGNTGRGAMEHCQAGHARIIYTITLSKAFGCFGGAVLGKASLRRKIFERSLMFAGSTPPPLPLVSAALESVKILSRDRSLKRRLESNANRLKDHLRKAGLAVPDHPGPIVALAPVNPGVSNRVRQALLAAGIYPSLLRYPGVPKAGYYRFVVSSEHTSGQIDRLANTLLKFTPDELVAPGS